MTAEEKFEQLQKQKKSHKDCCTGKHDYNGPDVNRLFVEKYNVVHQHKCCAYCRFGVPYYDGECSCLHPERIVKDENGVFDDVFLNTSLTDVCDAYEEKTFDNADIDYSVVTTMPC